MAPQPWKQRLSVCLRLPGSLLCLLLERAVPCDDASCYISTITSQCSQLVVVYIKTKGGSHTGRRAGQQSEGATAADPASCRTCCCCC